VLLIKLWNYLSGYVIIKINGEYGERLLNQAALKNIFLWDVRRFNDDNLTAKISVKDFFKIAPLAKKTRCRIRIVQRVGLYFLIYKLKNRKIFFLGAFLFIMAIYILSSFIWNMDVKCENNTLKSEVLNDLRRWGLKEGTFKYRVDKEYYIDKIMAEYNNVAWAEMEIKGSNLVVELVEKQLAPELEENMPCDIIASKDGIIEEIIPLRGEAVVEPGQTVSEGDVLITGKILFNQEQAEDQKESEDAPLFVHAQGIVKARVWYQKAVKIPLVKTKETPTGKSKRSIVIQVNDNFFNLQLGDISYNIYDRKVLKEFYLPELIGHIGFSIVKYDEMEIKKEFLGVDEACREAEEQLLLQLEDISKNNKVTQKKMEFMLDSDETSVIGSVIIEVIEDIGEKRKIG